MGKKIDISKLTKAKWVPFAVAAGAAIMAFVDSIGEHNREKEFESFTKRLSDLEKMIKKD